MAYLSETTDAIVSEACIDQMVQKIVDHVQPLQVILFGSYATGTPVTASDLDLFVVAESNLPRHKRSAKSVCCFHRHLVRWIFWFIHRRKSKVVQTWSSTL